MKYIAKRNIPWSGVIIPRGTKLPSKKYPVAGHYLDKWLARNTVAELNEEKIKVNKKANKELMKEFEGEEIASNPETDELSFADLKALAIELNIPYVGKKKAEIAQLIKEAQ
jgi:hypothetical protein